MYERIIYWSTILIDLINVAMLLAAATVLACATVAGAAVGQNATVGCYAACVPEHVHRHMAHCCNPEGGHHNTKCPKPAHWHCGAPQPRPPPPPPPPPPPHRRRPHLIHILMDDVGEYKRVCRRTLASNDTNSASFLTFFSCPSSPFLKRGRTGGGQVTTT